jgi:acetylornithine/succinyldiaminopimelate/putrescine aminotransferase
MERSFHGRTMGALSATGQRKYQNGFAPLLPGFIHVPLNDFEALKAAVTEKTCGVLIEPVQGEGGIRPAAPDYLKKVRDLCGEKGITLGFDEVQCGMGRTGRLFAHQLYGVKPDAVALAKGIAGGFPMGAALFAENAADVLKPGEHASTFGGGPLAAAAANFVFDRLVGGVIENAGNMGKYLTEKLLALKAEHPVITDVRGAGLMLGVELENPLPVAAKCMENGLLLINAGERVVRFVPPLIVTKGEIDEALRIFEGALTACRD